MRSYPVQKLTGYLADHTEAFLHKAVSEWQMLPHHQFAAKPAPDKWSANQCLAHLNEYGRYYLPLMESATDHAIESQQKPSHDFKPGWLGNYFTEMMLTNADGTPKKTMSAAKAYSPETNDSSFAVIAEFIEQQEKILVLLRKANKVDLNKLRIPISIAKLIKLKLGDTFLFLVAHNYRHILQADRALAKSTKKMPGTLDLFLLSELL